MNNEELIQYEKDAIAYFKYMKVVRRLDYERDHGHKQRLTEETLDELPDNIRDRIKRINTSDIIYPLKIDRINQILWDNELDLTVGFSE